MATLRGRKKAGQINYRMQNSQIRVTETEEYYVDAASAAENKAAILAAAGLPVIGVSVGDSGVTTCAALDATRSRDIATLWTVTASFESDVQEPEGDPNTDPTTWVPIYETKMERLDESSNIGYRIDNKTPDETVQQRITNSVDQPFRGRTKAKYLPYWEFLLFEAPTVSDATMWERQNTINSQPITLGGNSWPKHTLNCRVLQSVIGNYYRRRLRATLYRIVYNVDEWLFKAADVGTVHADQAQDKFVPYYVDGETIEGPLNGYGAPAGGYQGATDLANFDAGNLDQNQPWELIYREHEELPFNFLLR